MKVKYMKVKTAGRPGSVSSGLPVVFTAAPSKGVLKQEEN